MRKLILILALGAATAALLLVLRTRGNAPGGSASAGRPGLIATPPDERPPPLPLTVPAAPQVAAPLEAGAVPAADQPGVHPLWRPLISAIRGRHPDPAARRRAMLEALDGTGRSDEAWTQGAAEVFETWRRALPPTARGVRLSEVTCFRGGCVSRVSFADLAAYQAAASAFRSLPEASPRHGGRVQTPAIAENGEVVASWIFLRPFDG
jgi:hypothetical protein